jgi:hypothetical protein
MDQLRYAELLLSHRHRDGSWGRLEPQRTHHDPADHDAERTWQDGQVYACASCDEQVRVETGRRDASHDR